MPPSGPGLPLTSAVCGGALKRRQKTPISHGRVTENGRHVDSEMIPIFEAITLATKKWDLA